MLRNSKTLNLDHVNERLEQAILAYDAKTLERRIVIDGRIQTLSSKPDEARKQIKSVLNEGYQLVQNETGFFYLTQGLMGGSPLDELVKKLDTKPAAQRSVFITYQWNQKETAKALHAAFEAKGFLVIRDEDTLQNNVYLPGFMQIIGHKNLDYVLPVITESYLKSKSCMYEVNQVMKRYQWQKSLLPYVVTQDPKADARIYSGAGSYVSHWKQELQKAELDREKEALENILKNIEPFIEAVTTRINIPEPQMIAQQYQPLFDMIGALEKNSEHLKFKEIEELLRLASTNEKLRKHDIVKEKFDQAVAQLDSMAHLEGTDSIFAKVYSAYGEYLLRQNKDDKKGKEYLEIAIDFGFVQMRVEAPGTQSNTNLAAISVANANSVIQSNVSSGSSSANIVAPMTFSPTGSAAATAQSLPKVPVVALEFLKLFLKHVVEGEQEKAEGLLKLNKDLALVANDVTDLSGRTFKGITGFQYAVWALDRHMWTMIEKYMEKDDVKAQLQGMEGGSWVNDFGNSANWSPLILALDKQLQLLEAKKWEEAAKQWVIEVGGAQKQLPVHVVNEYCDPSSSFEKCPDFGTDRVLTRNRYVHDNDDDIADDWFKVTYKGGGLGNKLAISRGRSWAMPLKRLDYDRLLGISMARHEARRDHAACQALFETRMRERDTLFQKYQTSSHLRI